MIKVLITYASAGDGHKKAAEAIYDSLISLNDSDIKAVLADALDYSTPFFSFGYKKAYEIMIKYIPWLWGFFYHMLNNRLFFTIAAPFRRFNNGLNSRKLGEFIIKENFDLVLSTHFFALEVISHLKEKGLSKTMLSAIVTDFRPHRFWIAKNTDRYFVASDSTKKGFVKMGVPADKISVSGLPVGREFNNLPSKKQARSIIGMAEDKFTILLMGGGLGVGPIENIFLGLQKLNFDVQIIAVCGRNKDLFDKLNNLSKDLDKKTLVYGFSEQIGTFMASSDIIISKTGGITVSESLAAGLPMIIIRPIPGQEAGNAIFLCDNGVGFKAKSPEQVNAIITRLFRSKDDINTLKNSISLLSKSHAAEDILRDSMELIK
jgi:processive 1,2-diacylglycerol beta-glucosyltransferase